MVGIGSGATVAASQHGHRDSVGGQGWNDLLGNEEFNRPGLRGYIARKSMSKYVESSLGLVIFLNLVLVLLESDATVDGGIAPSWMTTANYCFITVYVVELVLKIFAFGLSFFTVSWNLVDFTIVMVDVSLMMLGWIIGNMPSVSIFRVFRLARLARAFKMLNMFPELKLLMQGLLGAAKAIFWGLIMVALLLVIWGILAVQVIHPINMEVVHTDERTARAFRSVWQSILTFFQTIVAGDSWGQVALPIIERKPWTFIFFMGVLVSVGLAMLNLILAVIVESATEARQQDQHQRALEHERQMQDAKTRLLQVCAEMDDDGSGTLSIEEFKRGFDESQEFADLLKIMNITKDDLQMVFKVVDQDNSGDVEYVEFVDNIHRMKSQESQLILFYVTEIRSHMTSVLEVLRGPKNKNKRDQAKAGLSPQADSFLNSRSEDKDLFAEGKEDKIGLDITEIKSRANEIDTLSGNVDKLMSICENLATKLERSSEKLESNSQALNSFKDLPYFARGQGGPVLDARFSAAAGARPGAQNILLPPPRSPAPESGVGYAQAGGVQRPPGDRGSSGGSGGRTFGGVCCPRPAESPSYMINTRDVGAA
eukprot:TRINITY_DN501_c0_g1_i2.p1 TRINITY_DN501_c0_g1~~TRINITY_DN501_c0_g1_i2.p1  ORF type:complete len:613 (-),score=126.26 TRINITY_DN501_c0_g1_i2:79-1866(-)